MSNDFGLEQNNSMFNLDENIEDIFENALKNSSEEGDILVPSSETANTVESSNSFEDATNDTQDKEVEEIEKVIDSSNSNNQISHIKEISVEENIVDNLDNSLSEEEKIDDEKNTSSTVDISTINKIIKVLKVLQTLSDNEKNIAYQFITFGEEYHNDEAKYVSAILNADPKVVASIKTIKEVQTLDPIDKVFSILDLDEENLKFLRNTLAVFIEENIEETNDKKENAKIILHAVDKIDGDAAICVETSQKLLSVAEIG